MHFLHVTWFSSLIWWCGGLHCFIFCPIVYFFFQSFLQGSQSPSLTFPVPLTMNILVLQVKYGNIAAILGNPSHPLCCSNCMYCIYISYEPQKKILSFFKDFIFLEQFLFHNKIECLVHICPASICTAPPLSTLPIRWCICYRWPTRTDMSSSPKVHSLH